MSFQHFMSQGLMTLHHKLLHPGTFMFAAILFSLGPLRASSEEMNVPEAYDRTIRAIDQDKFESAVDIASDVINRYGNASQGKDTFGPMYGHWYYLRGLAYIGMQQWGNASTAFEACYQCTDREEAVLTCKRCKGSGRIRRATDFTKGLSVHARDRDGKMPCTDCGGIDLQDLQQPNLFRMHALVQWGNCRMMLEDYAGALSLYRKVRREDRANRLKRSWKLYVVVNMGRCLIKSGEVEEGYQFLEQVLDDPKAMLRLKQIVFQVLAVDWTPLVSPEEVVTFLDDYAHVSMNSLPRNRIPANPTYFLLANDALETGDPLLSLRWFQLIAHPGPMIAEADQVVKRYEKRLRAEKRPKIHRDVETQMKKVRSMKAGWEHQLWKMVAGQAMAHFQLRNYAASLASYQMLADHVPRSSGQRPEFLYNAVVSAVQVDDWDATYPIGKRFLSDYSGHPHEPAVVRFLTEFIFVKGDYQKAYEIALELRTELGNKSAVADVPQFVLGASAYQLGEMGKADEELSAYLETYSSGQRRELATYFLASVKVKKAEWGQARKLLDPFLERYPESTVLSSTLYQNALCHFMLDSFSSAQTLLTRLVEKFPDDESTPAGWNLLGDIEASEEGALAANIVPSYLNAIASAEKFADQAGVAAYARWQLIVNYAAEEQWLRAGKVYDDFQQHHPDSAYDTDVLIASLVALQHLNRSEEGIQRLEKLLFSATVNDKEGVPLGMLFGNYQDYLVESVAPNEALERLAALGASPEAEPALKAWAILGRIELTAAVDGEGAPGIQELYQELDTEFSPMQHSNYVIINLARWHSGTNAAPVKAAALYDYILHERNEGEDLEVALLDRGQMLAGSDVAEDRKTAMAYFDRLLNECDQEEVREIAHVESARLLMREERVEEALSLWEAYMDQSGWSKFSAEANYTYAVCLDRLGKTKDALVVYVNTYNAFPGHVEFSTPAYLRAAHIMKDRGDDLKALKILKDMLSRLEHVDHPNLDEGWRLFLEWRDEYVPEKEAAQ